MEKHAKAETSSNFASFSASCPLQRGSLRLAFSLGVSLVGLPKEPLVLIRRRSGHQHAGRAGVNDAAAAGTTGAAGRVEGFRHPVGGGNHANGAGRPSDKPKPAADLFLFLKSQFTHFKRLQKLNGRPRLHSGQGNSTPRQERHQYFHIAISGANDFWAMADKLCEFSAPQPVKNACQGTAWTPSTSLGAGFMHTSKCWANRFSSRSAPRPRRSLAPTLRVQAVARCFPCGLEWRHGKYGSSASVGTRSLEVGAA